MFDVLFDDGNEKESCQKTEICPQIQNTEALCSMHRNWKGGLHVS